MTDEEIVQVFLRDAKQHPLLTKSEEQELGRRICDGDRAAVNELVQRNLLLVASVAMKLPTYPTVSRADLIQEGTIGLMHAAEKFDWRKGFKFSTYATWWIRQAVSRALSMHRVVRLPINVADDVAQMRRAREEIENETHSPASYAAVASRLGISLEKVAFLDDVARETMSLQAPLRDDDLTLEDVVAAEEIEELYLGLSKELEAALATLTEREREAVIRRHALDGRDLPTWSELGEELGVRKESARSLEQRGIAKLRARLDVG